MKKFVFTLESMLQARQSQDKEARRELARIEQRLVEQSAILYGLNDDLSDQVWLWRQRMASGLGSRILQQFDQGFADLRSRIADQVNRVQSVEQERERALERVQQLHREIRSLERLRDQQWQTHQDLIAQELDREMDEFISFGQQRSIQVSG